MYIRKVETKNPQTGKVYLKYQLVKSRRVDGVPRTEILLTLGKLSNLNEGEIKLLADRINDLFTNQHTLFPIETNVEYFAQAFIKKLLNKYFMEKKTLREYNTGKPVFETIDVNSINTITPLSIGGEYLCKQAFDELGFPEFFCNQLGWSEEQTKKVFHALTGRLLYASSERNTAKCLNENSGSQEFYPLASGMINRNQLYKASLDLYEHKDAIEKHIRYKVRDIFNYNSNILLYDLTNHHFEGKMNGCTKAFYGRNKQKRNDCKQITVGLVSDMHGFCQHSDYFSGNVSETKTLEIILDSLETKVDNQKKRQCVILDAGIATEDNLKLLLKRKMDYIAVSRSNHTKLKAKAQEEKLVTFENKSGDEISAKIFTDTFNYVDSGGEKKEITETLLFVNSPLKKAKEKSINQNKCDRFEKGLQSLQKTIDNPKGRRKIEQINQRLGRLKERCRGVVTYFDIELKDDGLKITSLDYKRKTEVRKEKETGTYIIRTNLTNQKDEKDLWMAYRIINEVETVFRFLKSQLDVRGIYHHKDDTIEAHINLTIQSYNVVNFIRHRLNEQKINHDWKEIVRIMSTQSIVMNAFNTKEEKTLWVKTCSRPTAKVYEIYKAMGYKNMPYNRKSILI